MPINYFINKSLNNAGASTNVLYNEMVFSKIYAKYVIYADWIESYVTLEHFTFVKNLTQYGWDIIKLSEVNVEKLKSEKSIVLCVTYDSFDISHLKCDNIKLIYKIDDLYPYKDIRKKCIDSADICIGP